MKDLKEMKERQVGEKKKNNNKGFSLVELIIVIAIMAILVGVVGTQVIPYIERSRIARDEQVLSSVATAALTAFSQNAANLDVTVTNYTIVNFVAPAAGGGTAPPAQVITDFQQLSGYSTLPNIQADLSSSATGTTTAITVTYNATNGTLTVQANGATGVFTTPITIQ